IVTNHHVVENAGKIKVRLWDERELQAKVVGVDEKTDLALIRVHAGKALPAATFGDSDKVEVGSWAIAIGNPFGFSATVTAGIISAEEIARQMRLRDLGGLIVIDFIDMEEKKHNYEVEKKFKEALKLDRAKIQVGSISQFGLLELSRQRLKPTFSETNREDCPRCAGLGTIRSVPSTAIHMFRVIEEEVVSGKFNKLIYRAPIDVANYILNNKRDQLIHLQRNHDVEILIHADSSLQTPDFVPERFTRSHHNKRSGFSKKDEQAKQSIQNEKKSSNQGEGDGKNKKSQPQQPSKQTRDEEKSSETAVTEGGEKRPRSRRRRRRRRTGNRNMGNKGASQQQTSKQEESLTEISEATQTAVPGLYVLPSAENGVAGKSDETPKEGDEKEEKAELSPSNEQVSTDENVSAKSRRRRRRRRRSRRDRSPKESATPQTATSEEKNDETQSTSTKEPQPSVKKSDSVSRSPFSATETATVAVEKGEETTTPPPSADPPPSVSPEAPAKVQKEEKKEEPPPPPPEVPNNVIQETPGMFSFKTTGDAE
ncbi:ribonuclease E/G, partial [Magnetococcales bacterium HHB-1]